MRFVRLQIRFLLRRRMSTNDEGWVGIPLLPFAFDGLRCSRVSNNYEEGATVLASGLMTIIPHCQGRLGRPAHSAEISHLARSAATLGGG